MAIRAKTGLRATTLPDFKPYETVLVDRAEWDRLVRQQEARNRRAWQILQDRYDLRENAHVYRTMVPAYQEVCEQVGGHWATVRKQYGLRVKS